MDKISTRIHFIYDKINKWPYWPKNDVKQTFDFTLLYDQILSLLRMNMETRYFY